MWRKVAIGKGAAPGASKFRTLKDENQKLRREFVRKEKALADAAALLIVEKNFARFGRTRPNHGSTGAGNRCGTRL